MRVSIGSGWSSGPTLILDSKGSYKIRVKDLESCDGKLEREHFTRVSKDVRLILETEWVAPTLRTDWITGDGTIYDISLWRHTKNGRGSEEYHYRISPNYKNLGRGWIVLGNYMHSASKVYEERCVSSQSDQRKAD